jgi:hypothetical protein
LQYGHGLFGVNFNPTINQIGQVTVTNIVMIGMINIPRKRTRRQLTEEPRITVRSTEERYPLLIIRKMPKTPDPNQATAKIVPRKSFMSVHPPL